MFRLASIKPRLRALFQKKRFEKEMDDELRFHLNSMIQNNIKSGMPPDEARRAALLSFGGMDQIKETCRDAFWIRCLDQLWQDLQYALRMLSRNPLSTLTTIAVIAGTIGLLCAAYAVLDAVILRTLPVPYPEQLVVINPITQSHPSVYDFIQGERQNISKIFGIKELLMYGKAETTERSLLVSGVRGDYFGTMGATPHLGRFLEADEPEPAAVISHRLWRKEFAGTPEIIGRHLVLGLLNVTIVGVARPDFVAVEEPYSEWDAILTWDMFCRARGIQEKPWLQIIARLKDAKEPKEYEAQLNSLWPSVLEATVPPQMTPEQWRDTVGAQVQVHPVSHGINYLLVTQPSIKTATQMIFGLSVLIFLSGSLTLALLAIARSMKNQPRTAIMTAIGGSRWRVQQPFLLETFILCGLGCAFGLLLCWWWCSLGRALLPNSPFLNWRVRIDDSVITLSLLMTVFIIMVISSVSLMSNVGYGSTGIIHSGKPVIRAKARLRIGLLALQLATSLLLISYALAFITGFSKLINSPVGFDPNGLSIHRLLAKPPERSIPDNYFHTMITQIEQLPGIESASITLGQPPAYPREHKQPVKNDMGNQTQATIVQVSPNYLCTIASPLLSGRDFSWSDRNAVIINQALSNKLYPDKSALGHTITYGPSGIPLKIIGIAGEMAYFGPGGGNSILVFVSCVDALKSLQRGRSVTLMIRSKRNLQDLKRAVQVQLDSPGYYYVAEATDQKTYLLNSIQQERMLATIAGIFGGFIMLLVGVELYAFSSYLLAMRKKELAIRASVGAGSSQITFALLKEIAKALGIGLAVGLAAIAGGERVLLNLFEINPPGLAYILWGIMIAAAVTISAVFMPVRRALAINLAKALRVD